MRFVAVLFGLAAGILILAMPHQAGIDLLPAFLKLWKNTDSQQLTAKIIWYAVPVAAIAGAVIAIVSPSIAALALLAAGLGWAGLELAVPAQFQYLAAVPAGLAVLGSIFAYVAGELVVRRRRLERRRNMDGPMLPQAVPARRSSYADDIEPGEDVEREAALRVDPLTIDRPATSTAPRGRYEIPLTLEDAATASQRVSVSAQPAGNRARPAAPVAAAPRAPNRAAGPVRGSEIAVEADRRPSFEPEPKPRNTGMTGWLIALNVVVLLAIGGGVAYFVLQKPESVATAQPAPPIDEETTASTTHPDATIVANTPAPTVPATDAPTADTPAPVALTGSYSDPFAYCAAIGTVDRITTAYTGPAYTAAMTASLGVPANASADRIHWRCLRGAVLACTSYGWPACDMTPDGPEMLAFCKLHPDVPRLLAPNGTWSCVKGRPELPKDASWPVDERGFLPQAWIPIAKPTTSG